MYIVHDCVSTLYVNAYEFFSFKVRSGLFWTTIHVRNRRGLKTIIRFERFFYLKNYIRIIIGIRKILVYLSSVFQYNVPIELYKFRIVKVY